MLPAIYARITAMSAGEHIEQSDHLDDATIAALADGESAAREALAHLEMCETCRELVSAVCARRTDAGEPGAPARLAPRMMLGRHRIERPIGAGGMGVVYLARDVELDREVAVKLLRGGDERSHARLVRESQALARLNHPNVVTAHEVGRHDGASYLIMEHVAGGNVREWAAAEPRTPLELAGIYEQCARGLAAAHAAALVHRDVKPDNLLVGSDGRARVSDFGLAATADDAGAALAGTPRYMAPEVLGGAPADARSDQWSLCASLWESLYGAPPFPGTTREELLAAIARGRPEVPAKPELPAWLRRAVLRGLASDPAARFPSTSAFADALAPSARPFRRTAVLVIASAAVAAGIGAAIGARDVEPACKSDLADVWNVARRGKLVGHLAALGSEAQAIAEPLAVAVDDYVRKWSVQRAEVCRVERSDTAGAVPALRSACLDARRHALATLLDLVANADAVAAPHALDAVGHLPALDDCAAAERLAGRQPRPAAGDKLAALEGLEHRLETARARADLGQQRPMVDELLAIAAGAEAIDYQPLVAEALDTAGRALHQANDPRTFPTLRRALWAAQAGGDDRELGDIAIALVNAAVGASRPITERDELRAQARAAVARLKWRKDPAALAAEAMLVAAEAADDLARGSFEAAEPELRRAIDLGVEAFGPKDPRLTPPRAALAKLMSPDDAAGGAAVVRAASLDADGTGPEAGASLSALIDAGWNLYGMGRDQEALEFVRKARVIAQRSPDSKLAAELVNDLDAELSVRTGDLAAARRLNDQAREAAGPTPIRAHAAGLWITQAEILEAEGKLAEAAAVYRDAADALALDRQTQQFANLGLVRCLAGTGQAQAARKLLEAEVGKGLLLPRDVPRMLKLLADLRWAAGQHISALAAARDGLTAADAVPTLTADREALVAWLAAHGAKPPAP